MTIGRIVRYKLSEDDVKRASWRRVVGAGHSENWPAGAQAHVGNPHIVGQELPLLVVSVYPHEFGQNVPGVNGQVFLDGNDVLWVTSIKEGNDPGTWHWPTKE